MANKKRKKAKTVSPGPKPGIAAQNTNEEAVSDSLAAVSGSIDALKAPEDSGVSAPAEKTEEAEKPTTAAAAEPIAEADAEDADDEPEEEELLLSSDTIAEIGSPDKDLVFRKVSKAYEEAKRSRENYKKVGPAFVFISGVIFLTLMFTLDNKITFLILWVASVLLTAALMIRTEYRYSRFRYYLGMSEEDSAEEDADSEEENGEEEDDASQIDPPQEDGSQEAEQAAEEENDPLTAAPEKDASQPAEQEGQA